MPADGQIEYVRWGPDRPPAAAVEFSRASSRARTSIIRWLRAPRSQRVDLDLDGPVNVMVDGEILRLNAVARNSSRRAGRDRMRKAWLTVRVARSVGGERNSFRGGRHRSWCFSAIFVDPRKNDWPQRVFFRNILRLAGVKFEVRRVAGLRPAAHEHLHLQSREHFRSLRDLFRDSAIRARLRAGIAFQDSDLRLDDGPLRKYSRAGCAQPRRPGNHDAAREGGARFRRQPDRVCRRLAHARRPRAGHSRRGFSISRRNLACRSCR